MWVMLLWSLTMPGHEVMVYDYLVKGSVNNTLLRLTTTQGEEETVKPESVEAYDFAENAPVLTIKQIVFIAKLVVLPALILLASKAAPIHVFADWAPGLLQKILPFSVLPNAP